MPLNLNFQCMNENEECERRNLLRCMPRSCTIVNSLVCVQLHTVVWTGVTLLAVTTILTAAANVR